MAEPEAVQPATAPSPAPAPAPKQSLKTDSSVEEAIEAVAEQVARSKSPFIAIAAIVVSTVVGGGGFSYGVGASSEAKAQYEVLTKKVDKLVEDAVRREAERHEERIRKLETSMAKAELEIELLKRGAK